MYCSTCGVAVAESLSYCNHCGARIISPNDIVATSREVQPGLLVSALAGTFILGLLAIAVLLGVLKSVIGLEPAQILGFAAVSFLMLILLEGVFLFLLFRRNRGVNEPARIESLPGHTTKELGAPQVQALPEPLTSVTDHTTRAFEPVYAKQNPQQPR